MEDLKKEHESKLRNPTIANALDKLGLVETWGRGTQKIVEECKKSGLPEPDYSSAKGFFGVKFIPKNPIGKTKVIDTPLANRQKEILSILEKHGSLSTEEILIFMGKSISIRTLRNDLSKLKDMGFIKVEGATNMRKWSIV